MDEERDITITAPPDQTEASPAMMDAILKAISELDIATHADVVAMNERQDAQNARIEAVETALAELPAKYASVDLLSKIKSSQEEYELRSRTLTEQVANLTLVTADSQAKFSSIQNQLNDLSGMNAKLDNTTQAFYTFTDNITTFMQVQRQSSDNHDARIRNADMKIAELSGAVTQNKDQLADTERRFIQDYIPLRDVIKGSDTQKSLKEKFSDYEAAAGRVSQDLAQLSSDTRHISEYIKAQQAKEEARANYYQRIKLNLATPKGLIAVLIFIIGIIMVMNAFSLDQLFARIQQAAGLYQAFQSGK